ncbi:hypothetical protein FHS43_006351 [Streptosporangium becharense]|uniref:Uncharacterized protein n=1 Tax=Streptosporangium becharense TaxID=1816182 RepID=A0A7W9ICA0_9ACTN|nr:hypothetical protein [Streptosporangium becharense]MBB5818085.1 hypothetical protein [Streptosporangium becharense]
MGGKHTAGRRMPGDRAGIGTGPSAADGADTGQDHPAPSGAGRDHPRQDGTRRGLRRRADPILPG